MRSMEDIEEGNACFIKHLILLVSNRLAAPILQQHRKLRRRRDL